MLRHCDLVFSMTKDMNDRIREAGYGGDIAMFRFGVDPAVFRKTAPHGTDEFRVLDIRPCSKIYNPLVVVEAFRSLAPQMPRAYLYLSDYGEMIEKVRAAVDQDPLLKQHTRFVPKRPHQEMVDVYNNADIAISVASSDGFPSSVLEALACELPVIGSSIPPIRECIKDGVDGYLTEIDPSVLADKIRKSFSLRTMLATMGRRAREMILDPANQFTFESNIKVAEEAYEKLLASP